MTALEKLSALFFKSYIAKGDWQYVKIAPAKNISLHDGIRGATYCNWQRQQGQVIRVRPVQLSDSMVRDFREEGCDSQKFFFVDAKDTKALGYVAFTGPVRLFMCEHQIKEFRPSRSPNPAERRTSRRTSGNRGRLQHPQN